MVLMKKLYNLNVIGKIISNDNIFHMVFVKLLRRSTFCNNVFLYAEKLCSTSTCYGCIIFKTRQNFWGKIEQLLNSTFSPWCILEIVFKINK